MLRIRLGSWLARTRLTLAVIVTAMPTFVGAQSANERRLINEWELHRELRVDPASEAKVKEYFPSFLEYQDLVMFHPTFGYYSSGRVSFTSDYQTFPIVLDPYFGQMVAEQVFRMWQGMRRAGTLKGEDKFTIAEFGAGDGTLAESILDYLDDKSRIQGGRAEWTDFVRQVAYICYDRSPALSRKQKERNARFGTKFDAREADATNPVATIEPGSLKGVILSNELPDAFSVHKVVLSPGGAAEVAFVAPSFGRDIWARIRAETPASVVEIVESGDRAIVETFFSGQESPSIYLSRKAFVALLEALNSSNRYSTTVQALQFQEVYVPVTELPELTAHLRRHASTYAGVLARKDSGIVTYINLGVEKYLQGAGRILSAGYVMTIDYGANWEGILAQDSHPHLRTYGPANREANGAEFPEGENSFGQDTYDPYVGPTLNDLTTDVNFSLMAAEGQPVGLRTVFYGMQRALQTGTGIEMVEPGPSRRDDSALAFEFDEWLSAFLTDGNFKLMVQQKEGTDSEYQYPDMNPEPLDLSQSNLSEAQKTRLEEIEARLSGAILEMVR